MPTPASDGTTNLYLTISGVGQWSSTIPYDITLIGSRAATEIVELSVARAIEWFLENYMPLRFNPGYARANLGYQILGSTWKKKMRRASHGYPGAVNPNVWSGATRQAALMGSRPETRAIGGRTSMTVGAVIRMNLPGYINQQRSGVTRKVMDTITSAEGQKIANQFFKEVATAASRFNVETIATRGGKLKVRTSAAPGDVAQFGRSSRATIITQRRSGVVNYGVA